MAAVKKTSSDKATTGNAARSYSQRAADLADDARALAESINEDLAKLRARSVDDFADTPPEPTDAPAVDGVRRIPMAIDEVNRALDGLTVTAADLARSAAL